MCESMKGTVDGRVMSRWRVVTCGSGAWTRLTMGSLSITTNCTGAHHRLQIYSHYLHVIVRLGYPSGRSAGQITINDRTQHECRPVRTHLSFLVIH